MAQSTDDSLASGTSGESIGRRLMLPGLIFLVSFAIFALLAGDRLKQASDHNHFVHLAQGYLDGRLELDEPPPHGNDWASYVDLTLSTGEILSGNWTDRGARKFTDLHGNLYVIDREDLRGSSTETHYFVSFPPMPAVLMIPGVAIWGMAFNDVLFTALVASANVALFYWLLAWLVRSGRTSRSRSDNLWLTALFGFGTAHLWCSVLGQVWFTGLVVGVLFSVLFVRFALDPDRPFLAGLFLACGFAARTPLLFSVLVAGVVLLFPDGRFRRDWGLPFWRRVALFGAAPIAIGVALMLANHARFDSYSEFGHTYLAYGQNDRIREFGLFNVHFLTRNLTAMMTLLPKFQPTAPYIVISRHGLALWFTTPAFLWLLWPRLKGARQRMEYSALLLGFAAIALLHVTYQNTGWEQFSFRFAMDYIAILTVALAIGGQRIGPALKLAILWGIAWNLFGALTFQRAAQFYGDFFIEAAPL